MSAVGWTSIVVDGTPTTMAIGKAAQHAMAGRAPAGRGRPLALRATFLLKPTAAAKRRRIWPTRRSRKLDTLLRLVLDALRDVAYVDDTQVVQMDRLGKDYAVDGWTGAIIEWREITG